MKQIKNFIFIVLGSLTNIYAHNLWLNVDNYYPSVGEKTNVKIAFGHNFPYYDILLSSSQLAEFYFVKPDGSKKEITKIWEEKEDDKKGALAGEIFCDTEGTYIVSACRKQKGDIKHVPSEKYGKAIIVIGKGNKNISKPLGHRLEFIPLKNPQEIELNKTLPVQVLYEGKPLPLCYVYATYAGYHSETEPYPVVAMSNKKGIAYIKITQPGRWLVTVSYKVDISATLTFERRVK